MSAEQRLGGNSFQARRLHAPPTGGGVGRQLSRPARRRRPSFWLHGATWEYPTYDNAEAFIAWLVKEDLLVCDSVVPATLQAQLVDLSPRSVQRRFLHATGLTHGAISHIERAHYAVALLRGGVLILDTVERAGYADQPHLTRSLSRLIGQTPGQLSAQADPVQLSYSPMITLGMAPAT